MLLLLPAAKLLFYVKHFELFCTWNVLQINSTALNSSSQPFRSQNNRRSVRFGSPYSCGMEHHCYKRHSHVSRAHGLVVMLKRLSSRAPQSSFSSGNVLQNEPEAHVSHTYRVFVAGYCAIKMFHPQKCAVAQCYRSTCKPAFTLLFWLLTSVKTRGSLSFPGSGQSSDSSALNEC